MRATLLFVLCLTALPAIGQSTPQTVLFDRTFRPQSARIVSQQEMVSLRAPTALVRLPNGKLAIMVRDQAGKPQPFYARGIENGYLPLPPGLILTSCSPTTGAWDQTRPCS